MDISETSRQLIRRKSFNFTDLYPFPSCYGHTSINSLLVQSTFADNEHSIDICKYIWKKCNNETDQTFTKKSLPLMALSKTATHGLHEINGSLPNLSHNQMTPVDSSNTISHKKYVIFIWLVSKLPY